MAEATANHEGMVKKLIKSYYKEIKARRPNTPTLLLLLYSLPISMANSICQAVMYYLFSDPMASSCYYPFPEVQLQNIFIAELVQTIYLYLAYPISGWLADTKLGRGKAINVSLWLCWLGMLALTCSYLVQYTECGLVYNIFKYGVSSVGLLLMMFGMADFHTNALAYMFDQMPDASTIKLRSCIRWFTWTLLIGFNADFIVILHETLTDHTIVLATLVVTFVSLSVLISLHQFFQDKFVNSQTVKRNPYKTVYRVLKYAWSHKNAENRSSLTFWENKTPSRLDLGKNKYGGPFPEKDVEDVKSFGRVVVIFIALGGIFIPYFNLVYQAPIYGGQFKGLYDYGTYVIWQPLVIIGILVVPILDLLVIPIFPKFEYFISNPLRGLLGTHLLAIAALATLATLHLVAFFLYDEIECYPSVKFPDTNYGNISFLYLIIPCLLIGFYACLCFLEPFQFLCSQAPHEMSGMLMGTFWFIRAVYISIGTLVSYPFTINNKRHYNLPACTFWVLLALLIIATIGTAVFAFATCWYNRRERVIVLNTQHVIENHYERYLDRIPSPPISNGLINDFVFPLAGWSDNVVPHD